MTRIAFVFHAHGGGVQRTQVILANRLSERGFQVSVVMPQARGPFLSQLVPAVELVDLNSPSRPGFILALARYLRRERPDRLLVSQHHTGVHALMAKLLAGFPGPVIVMIHNHFSNVVAHGQCSPLLPALMRLFYRWSGLIACVSAGVAEDFGRRFPALADRLRIVSDPVAVEEALRLGSVAPCGEDWLDHKTSPCFVAVGGLSPQKDFPTLLRAMAAARRRFPCRLIIVGEGPERVRLRRLIEELGLEDAVRLVGFQANPYQFMSKADALVVSSRWEGFCLVIVEALALGIPVISTDCPSGPGEILDGGRFGRLVGVGDVDELAAALGELTAGDLRFSPSALRRRAAVYAIDEVLPHYLRILEEAAERA